MLCLKNNDLFIRHEFNYNLMKGIKVNVKFKNRDYDLGKFGKDDHVIDIKNALEKVNLINPVSQSQERFHPVKISVQQSL